MAEIQALMPNGTYRAMVAQREVVLSLPFSAKAGDSLELEVVESEGKLGFAFIGNRPGAAPSEKAAESVSTTLSQAGKLIGNLLGGIDDQGKRPPPALLNGNQPLAEAPPVKASELVPLLKETLSKSGMFYESHQARWVEGKLPAEALLQEPQGKFSTIPHAPTPAGTGPQAQIDGAAHQAVDQAAASITTPASAGLESLQKGPSQAQIPPELAPLVQQQLDALATQNFVWQGQVWPGQHMEWEIHEDRDNPDGSAEDTPQKWHTRLKLALPGLGGINAVMRLGTGNTINVSLVTETNESREKLVVAGEGLRQQLENAGLNLIGLAVQHGPIPD